MSLLLLFVVSCGASKVFSVDVEGKGEILLSPEQERENERHREKGGTPYIPLEKQE